MQELLDWMRKYCVERQRMQDGFNKMYARRFEDRKIMCANYENQPVGHRLDIKIPQQGN